MIPFDNKQQQQMNRICRKVDTFLLKTQGLKKMMVVVVVVVVVMMLLLLLLLLLIINSCFWHDRNNTKLAAKFSDRSEIVAIETTVDIIDPSYWRGIAEGKMNDALRFIIEKKFAQ